MAPRSSTNVPKLVSLAALAEVQLHQNWIIPASSSANVYITESPSPSSSSESSSPDDAHSPESVFVLAEAGAFAVHAVLSRRAHPVSAVRPAEARLAQAAAVDVVAARPVGAVAHALAVLTVGARSALLVAPEQRNSGRWVRGCSQSSGLVLICTWTTVLVSGSIFALG